MRAAWYEHKGGPKERLVVPQPLVPRPGPGELRIALTVSGLNLGDVKKRAGWQGSPTAYPRVIPHSDGAGIVDAVGPGVSQERIGERVWCYGTQFPEVKAQAAAELGKALVDGDLRSTIAARFPLERIAEAHELVEAVAPGRVPVEI
jgi:NADPH:quinone reductase-like Zn-dependent oxidoreductase